ncbi:MAG: IS1634 family transposase [Candidatus Cloacimonetes bacterium]|nr:IS1634 family transposase [Candidatus Cloacimonadota bacterium]
MFIKATRAKGHDYLKIVESYYKDGKSKHRTIVNLGRADILANSGLENIIRGLRKYVKENKDQNDNIKDISTMKEENRVNYGYVAFQTIWNKYSLSELLNNLIREGKIEFNFVQTVFLMVINQLLHPSSSRMLSGLQRNQDDYLSNEQNIPLHHFYRSLDLLAENKPAIENALFSKNRDLFNMQVYIVFYDVTTFHFESQLQDGFRDFGFSKSHKFNEVSRCIGILGILIDCDGRPIGYELYPGNTFDSPKDPPLEGKTLLKILKKLQDQFNLNKVIIVADKGINSKLNLKHIKDNGFDYIVSARIKNMKRSIQKEILSDRDYRRISNNDLFYWRDDFDKEDNILKYKVLDYTNVIKYEDENPSSNVKKHKWIKEELEEKLICTFSSKRARKDALDRQRAIEKAMKVISENNKSAIFTKRGYKRFVADDRGELEKECYHLKLDEERILEESKFDGFYAIQCSDLSLEPLKVIDNYHYLFKIEESFRILKSTMETRPIFLWTSKHIEGHFVSCFIAFLLERELELRLRRRKIDFSTEKIKEALNTVGFSEIEIEGQKYFMKGKHNSLASKIFAVLKIKQPLNLLSEEQTIEYMEGLKK